jgi:hypothetical protein
MFVARADPEAELAEQKRLAAQPAKYETALAEMHTAKLA